MRQRTKVQEMLRRERNRIAGLTSRCRRTALRAAADRQRVRWINYWWGDPMKNQLLTIDGTLNMILGVLLIAFPTGVVRNLGIPGGEGAFYPGLFTL